MPKKIALTSTDVTTDSDLVRVGIAYPTFFSMFQRHYPALKTVKDATDVRNFDLIIFSGGEDLDPKLYGEENIMSYDANTQRDTVEMNIFKEADKLGILMYGSCRGAQLINVGRKGSLHQDLRMAGVQHNGNHPLSWEQTSEKLQPIFNNVNSLHHQGIKNMGSGLYIYATHNSVPEIIYGKNVMATQFHPEMMSGMEAFFQLLLDWAKNNKKKHEVTTPAPAEA